MEKINVKDINNQIETLRDKIRSYGTSLSGKRLTRHTYNLHRFGIVDNDEWSLDSYYIGLINDMLNSIRLGKEAWVFNLNQLADIFRFEPNVDVTYDKFDEVFYLSK